jgi:hypothetical protein
MAGATHEQALARQAEVLGISVENLNTMLDNLTTLTRAIAQIEPELATNAAARKALTDMIYHGTHAIKSQSDIPKIADFMNALKAGIPLSVKGAGLIDIMSRSITGILGSVLSPKHTHTPVVTQPETELKQDLAIPDVTGQPSAEIEEKDLILLQAEIVNNSDELPSQLAGLSANRDNVVFAVYGDGKDKAISTLRRSGISVREVPEHAKSLNVITHEQAIPQAFRTISGLQNHIRVETGSYIPVGAIILVLLGKGNMESIRGYADAIGISDEEMDELIAQPDGSTGIVIKAKNRELDEEVRRKLLVDINA